MPVTFSLEKSTDPRALQIEPESMLVFDVAAAGPFEAKALELVGAGRALDLALERHEVTKTVLAEALQAWREAVERLPKGAGEQSAER